RSGSSNYGVMLWAHGVDCGEVRNNDSFRLGSSRSIEVTQVRFRSRRRGLGNVEKLLVEPKLRAARASRWQRCCRRGTNLPVAPSATEESCQTVRSLSCLAPPRRMAASALLRSRARRSAWVACARLWTLYKAATSARAPTAAAKLRQAPGTAHGCPTENALLIPPRRVGLAAGRPAVL